MCINNRMEKLDLEGLAADTARKLHAVWDELGINNDERGAFLNQLSIDVAAIYTNRVDNQITRKCNTEAEISQLQSMICSLQNSMLEQAEFVSVTSREMVFERLCQDIVPYERSPHVVDVPNLQPQGENYTLIQYRDILEQKRSGLQQVRTRRSLGRQHSNHDIQQL